jgi:hypothetical protein
VREHILEKKKKKQKRPVIAAERSEDRARAARPTSSASSPRVSGALARQYLIRIIGVKAVLIRRSRPRKRKPFIMIEKKYSAIYIF